MENIMWSVEPIYGKEKKYDTCEEKSFPHYEPVKDIN